MFTLSASAHVVEMSPLRTAHENCAQPDRKNGRFQTATVSHFSTKSLVMLVAIHKEMHCWNCLEKVKLLLANIIYTYQNVHIISKPTSRLQTKFADARVKQIF